MEVWSTIFGGRSNKLITARSTGYYKRVHIPGCSNHILLVAECASYNQRGSVQHSQKDMSLLLNEISKFEVGKVYTEHCDYTKIW